MLASHIPLKQADIKPWSRCCPRGQRQWLKRKRSLPQKHADLLAWNATPHVLDGDGCLGPKWAQNFPEVGHLLQSRIEHWGALTQEMTEQPSPHSALHVKLTQTLVTDAALAQCELLMFNRRLLYPVSLGQQGTNVYDSTLQTKIIDVATSQQEETSEECVFLIFLLPEKWRVLSVWLTSMFFTCDIFKLWDPALIGMQKVWLFSRPTPKGRSARDRWQQELRVGHLQVYSGGRKLKRSSFRIYECQPYAKK